MMATPQLYHLYSTLTTGTFQNISGATMATVTFEALMSFVQCHTCIVRVEEFIFNVLFPHASKNVSSPFTTSLITVNLLISV